MCLVDPLRLIHPTLGPVGEGQVDKLLLTRCIARLHIQCRNSLAHAHGAYARNRGVDDGLAWII